MQKKPLIKKIVLFVLSFAILAIVQLSHAQQQGKIFRIGYLDSSTASGSAVLVKVFLQELSKVGWIEGKNIAIEYRFGEGKSDRLPELASDLVRLKVDLIVVTATPAALAAKNASTAIPIVMASGGDPVGAGLVASLARPGGNVTGLSSLGELNTKRLEILLKTRFPSSPELGFCGCRQAV
jgi:putative ABC transport system substrate-binding protein